MSIFLIAIIVELIAANKYWSQGRTPPTYPGRPLKILFDCPGGIPI